MKEEEPQPISGYTEGFGIAAAATALLNSLLVVLKETDPHIKTLMKSATCHHWITQALILLVIYIVLGSILSKAKAIRKLGSKTLLLAVIASVLVSVVTILGYYILHYRS